MEMKCEFDYCIYNKEFICILDQIEMNSIGMCELCEIVTLPKEKIEAYKGKRLEEIRKMWQTYDK